MDDYNAIYNPDDEQDSALDAGERAAVARDFAADTERLRCR